MTTTTHDSSITAAAPAAEEAPTVAPAPAPLPRGIAIAIAIVLACAVLLRLSAYGIWDPWELSVADSARKLGEGALEQTATLTLWLVQGCFAMFGSREWAGRLPFALCGLGLLLTIALWVRRYAGSRVGA
ncbi:MAG TPA: hypothetical protein VI299_17975, partial [Polyangiales bacterium]